MRDSVILVEGESDRAALESAARVLDLDLASVTILVMNGATNVVRLLAELVSEGRRVAGL